MAQRTPRHTQGTRARVPAKLIVAAILIVIALIFILQNRQNIQIYLLTATLSGPLWAVLVGVVVLGGLTGFLLARGRR
ncbi:DUF1049 domain-containing protein [Saccharomonospora sp. NPDC046836]|uniref:DUF1049 domain-containing protein n=1 Tax=Saccharomonospora sp. NPDC046836 TaxID=3156921 RepID=UPI0033F69DC0